MDTYLKFSIQVKDNSIYLCIKGKEQDIEKCLCEYGDNIKLRAVFEGGTVVDINTHTTERKEYISHSYIWKIKNKGTNTYTPYADLYFIRPVRWFGVYNLDLEDVISYGEVEL